jgi:hypothetical protein
MFAAAAEMISAMPTRQKPRLKAPQTWLHFVPPPLQGFWPPLKSFQPWPQGRSRG